MPMKTHALVTTLAGLKGTKGSVDGVGGAARFYSPAGVAMDAASGVALVADTDNHAIRRIVLATGAVTTLAGGMGSSGSVDGGRLSGAVVSCTSGGSLSSCRRSPADLAP